MKKGERTPFSLNFGLREKEVLKEIDGFIEKDVLPKSKNEIFRRGLYACRYLADVDEKLLLSFFSKTLHSLTSYFDQKNLAFSRDLASTIFAVLISKQGISKADIFENILITLDNYVEFLKNNKITSTQKIELQKSIEELAISVDTLFLEKSSSKIEKSEAAYYAILMKNLATNEFQIIHKKQDPSIDLFGIGNIDTGLADAWLSLKQKKFMKEIEELDYEEV